MEKRSIIIILLFVVVAIFSVFLVSAQGLDLRQGSNQVVQWIEDFFSPFLIALYGGEFLFEKALFFILMIALVYSILSSEAVNSLASFTKNRPASIIITLVISLLGTRYLTEVEWVKGILLPYSVLGVALLSIFPLVIFFYFLEASIDNSVIRKIAWSLYAATFIVMAYLRSPELGNISWIYIGTAVIAILFILFDKPIRNYFNKLKIFRSLDSIKVRQVADIKKAIEERFAAKVLRVNVMIGPDGRKKAYVSFDEETPAIDVATKLGMM